MVRPWTSPTTDEASREIPLAPTANRGSPKNYRGLWYQKNANATSATVMIHRTMSLLRFFSSAINEVEHTSSFASSVAKISRLR